MFDFPNVSLFTGIIFFITHLVGSIVGFLITTNVVVVIEVLDVLTVGLFIYLFIFIVVIIILVFISYSCMN